MGNLLDREEQLNILRILADHYPEPANVLGTFGKQHDNTLKVNLAYLQEHGLIDLTIIPSLQAPHPLPTDASIPAKGLDFLADDGGLSAILGVVTVRFADQEIRNLLVQRIANEEGDETIKSRMVEAVRSLPAEAIKGIGTKAIEHGIASFPAGLAAIRAMLEI